jgi:ABC-type glycerol-3-phosphate transport system substrate-binding protein
MTEHGTDDGPSESRRRFLKGAGSVTAAGALGALAGCTGNGEDQGGNGDQSGAGGDQSSGGDSGGSEGITVSFWSGDAAENSSTRSYYQQSMKNYESQHENVNVDLQPMSYGDMATKLVSAVQAGNAPDMAQGGATALQFYFNDKLVDHGKYIEQAEGLPDNWTKANLTAATYRDKFWAGGSPRHTYTMLGLVPKFFKDVGVSDPSQISTWTGFRRALDKIKKQHPNTYAFEVTGSPGDLESYWGEARTAWTGGKDPWIEGSGENTSVKIGKNGRTDGMILNNIDLANTYSSPQASKRGDEQMPSLMLTGRIASFSYAVGNAPRYRAVKDDVTFGWDGDIWQGPIPKLDKNYGKEFNIPELAGKEGEHGGHAWGLEQQKQVYKGSNNPDEAWNLLYWTNTSADHLVKLYGEIYPAAAAYKPLNEKILNAYKDKTPQIFDAMLNAAQEYGTQYQPTGAAWDIKQTSQIRWTDINETLSQGIAGSIKREKVPQVMRDRVMKTLNSS